MKVCSTCGKEASWVWNIIKGFEQYSCDDCVRECECCLTPIYNLNKHDLKKKRIYWPIQSTPPYRYGLHNCAHNRQLNSQYFVILNEEGKREPCKFFNKLTENE